MKWKLTRKFLSSIVITVITTLLCFCISTIFLLYIGSANPDEVMEVRAPIITEEFADKLQIIDDSIYIEEKEISELKNYNAWIQVLDENGTEVYNKLKPDNVPNHYTPGEIVYYHKYSGAIEGYTIFLGIIEKDGRKFSYIMGYPVRQVEKYSFNFNPETLFKNIFKLIITTVIIFTVISTIVGYLFSIKLTKPIFYIMEEIKSLSHGNFTKKFFKKGIYEDVYSSLDNLSETLKINELETKNTEKMREEWIANITHDIRTPLTSIKGYSEMLLDSEYNLSVEERSKYTEIILNKANYIESLVDDLKLTYQLKNTHIPLNKKDENLVEVLRETIIDILNNPRYENADINFESEKENTTFRCDSIAFKRAFTNIIYNALVHNTGNTKVWISLSNSKDITVEIKDNGKGIAQEELNKLFDRYYRGTNTGELHKGSGLGMAISKQIFEAHGGKIVVDSKLGIETTIKIVLPKGTN